MTLFNPERLVAFLPSLSPLVDDALKDVKRTGREREREREYERGSRKKKAPPFFLFSPTRQGT